MSSAFRMAVKSQMWLSKKLDLLLPKSFRVDGNADFSDNLVPKFVTPHSKLYDVGGGKQPYLSREKKQALNVSVVGIDIQQTELDQAPPGAYEQKICADICQFRGSEDGDFVVCQAVLEHVRDVEGAFASMASILKKDGLALLFVPSRNACFARLNLVLPERIKRRILFGFFPWVKSSQGFPSYYDRCTLRNFRELSSRHGFVVEEVRAYYASSYFSVVFPIYAAWRAWVVLFRVVCGENAAETFSIVLRKA